MVRAAQGSISILDPDEPGLVHASKSGCMLGRILEGDIVTGRLGQPAPEKAPDDWRIHEVMLAFASLQYQGPAACIYAPSSHAIASTVAVPADSTLIVTDKNSSFYLDETDILKIQGSANNDLEYTVSGEILDDA